MQHLKIFIELTRLNKPIGYMLLFWPCLWGLTLAYNFNYEIYTFIKYAFLFLLGAYFFLTDMKRTVIISIMLIKIPGKIPAKKSFPIEVPLIKP